MKKKFGSGNFLMLSLLVFSIAVFSFLSNVGEESPITVKVIVKDVKYNQFIEEIEKGNVEELSESAPFVIGKLYDKKGSIKTRMISDRLADDSRLMSLIQKSKISVTSNSGSQSNQTNSMFWVIALLPTLILVLGMFIVTRKMPSSFGGSNNRPDNDQMRSKSKVTFKDVAGLEEVKQELIEVVDFLKHPAKFKKLGAKIPRGLMMLGQPGTGKTLLAKAVAGEAGVPFFNVSGAEFVEMFVGVGASRVRELFAKARKYAPCIIFIDEIDAIAKKRGGANYSNNDERDQTLNQLLIEMDGFSEKENVIVIAATNRPDTLDKAFIRPGRFDRQLVVDAPSLKDREAILQVHAKGKPLNAAVNLMKLARKTAGFVGADLANILNEAAILAARHNREEIIAKDVDDAFERVIAGPERKSKLMSDKEKEIVAYHESGHALVAYSLPNMDPVHKISIIPRGHGALGYTMQLPIEDKFLITKSEFLNEIKVLMGGRAAEDLIFNEITNGASNDIEKATKVAREMVSKYGMSLHFGPQLLAKNANLLETAQYSNETAKEIDNEVRDIIFTCYKESRKILSDNIDKLKRLTKALLEREIIFEEEMPVILESQLT